MAEPMDQAPNDALPSSLSGAIEGILAHPELISMVASALGKSPPVAEGTKAEEKRAEGEAPVASPLATEVESASRAAPSPEALSALAPLLSGLSGAVGGRNVSSKGEDSRICLLRALKPYLSAGRCEAIDYMIRLSALSDALRGWSEGSKGGF